MALLGLIRAQQNETGITGRQSWTLATLGMALMMIGAAQSVMPPLFPILALSKDLTTWKYCMVFGAFSFARVLVTSFENNIINFGKPKFLSVSGLFLTGGATILFGLMEFSPGGRLFFLLNTLIQLIIGVGYTLTYSAVLLLISRGGYSNNSVYFMALVDTFAMAGLVAGAPLGTILYSFNNMYSTPFIITGVLILLIATVAAVLIEGGYENVVYFPSVDDVNIFLRIPLVWVSLSAIFLNALTESYILITLAEALIPFKLGVVGLGGMFLATYLFASIGDFITGILIHKTKFTFLLTSFGSSLIMFGLMFIGPATFLNLNAQKGTIAFGLILKGIGSGSVVSSSFAGMLRIARNQLPDNFTTYYMVQKATTYTGNVGYLVGAMCTGLFYQGFGPRLAASFLAAMFLFLFFVCALTQCSVFRREREIIYEETPLCDCSMKHYNERSHFEHRGLALNSSLDQDSAEWGWLYGRNNGL